MAQVSANTSCVLTVNGMTIPVRAGDRFNDDDDIVRLHPAVFAAPIEEATASPGQRRNAPRR